MYSLLDHWGLGPRIRPVYLAYRTFFSWEDVMVLLDSLVLAGLQLMLLPVSVGGLLVDSCC